MVVSIAVNFSGRHISCLSSVTASLRNFSLQPKRPFSTTFPTLRTLTLPEGTPPYPYGSRLIFKQGDSGLYGGASILFGNKISRGRNKGKTRRIWKPNVRKEKLYSSALGEHIELKVTHRVLRTINKVGGLDEYLLCDKPSRLKELGIFGWRLRWKVMTSLAMKDKFQQERQQLGLPEPESFEEYLAKHTSKEQTTAAIEHHEKRQQEKEYTPSELPSGGELGSTNLNINMS